MEEKENGVRTFDMRWESHGIGKGNQGWAGESMADWRWESMANWRRDNMANWRRESNGRDAIVGFNLEVRWLVLN